MTDASGGKTADNETTEAVGEGETPVSEEPGYANAPDAGTDAADESVDTTDDTHDVTEEDPVVEPLPSVEELMARAVQAEELQLRLAAEFSNYRRRTERNSIATWARAQAEIVGRILDVLDDLDRVRQVDLSQASVESVMEGVNLVADKFVRVLVDAGVQVIDPEREEFDPNTMEAVMTMPADSDEEVDHVGSVLQKGYSLGDDHLIRPARVGVFKGE